MREKLSTTAMAYSPSEMIWGSEGHHLSLATGKSLGQSRRAGSTLERCLMHPWPYLPLSLSQSRSWMIPPFLGTCWSVCLEHLSLPHVSILPCSHSRADALILGSSWGPPVHTCCRPATLPAVCIARTQWPCCHFTRRWQQRARTRAGGTRLV